MSNTTPSDPTPSNTYKMPADAFPPWVWLLVALGGAGGAGSVGSVFGSQVSKEEVSNLRQNVEKVETKLDQLDAKLDELTLQIVRYHTKD